MPPKAHRTLSFPMGGVVRREDYRKQTRPYSAPWAINVRGIDSLENRERGGSRPGLVEVSGVTTESVGQWQWPNGEVIQWPEGSDIEYDYVEDLIEGPNGEKIVNPASAISVTAEVGDAPAGYSISCIYRDRVIIAKDNIWYASRMGNHRDWDYGAEMTDSARAVAGTIELAGQTGGNITAVIPFRDQFLIIATKNSLRILEGDPATGSIRILDEDIGIIAPYGWAFSGDTLAFLSNDGIYLGPIGQRPAKFSDGRIPENLKNVDVSSNTVTMAYDRGANGFHLFITPSTGTGEHYFLEIDTTALWPVAFGDDGHQPVVAAKIKSDNLERVMLKGRDGTWREFSSSASDDDGTTLKSDVLVGPVRLVSDDVRDALLTELHAMMAAGTAGAVNWRLIMGDDAESAVDAAKADLDAGTMANVSASGTWGAGRNTIVRPRSRGAWAVLWLTSNSQWAYEAIAVVAQRLGRIR